MLLLNDKRAVNAPWKASEGTEKGGQGQKHKGLGNLIFWTKSKPSCHRTSRTPQEGDSSKKQNQLQDRTGRIIRSYKTKWANDWKLELIIPLSLSCQSLPFLQSQSRVQTKNRSCSCLAGKAVTSQMSHCPLFSPAPGGHVWLFCISSSVRWTKGKQRYQWCNS